MKDRRHRQSAVGPDEGLCNGAHLGPGTQTAAVFTPDIVKAMGEGFDLAWTAIVAANLACATGHSGAETRRRLALAILEAARLGTRDCNRLSASALGGFLPWTREGEDGLDRSGSR